MTTPAPIAATTEQGSGLVLPIAKALTHIMAVYTAINREWPMSIADASAELEDARAHFAAASVPRALMTAEATTTIDAWSADLQQRINALQAAVDLDAQLASIEIEPLKSLARDSWQLLVNLDRELTGLEPRAAEPGNLP